MQHIEEKIAHLQHQVDEMSDVIARQDAEMRKMQNQLRQLIEREIERDAENPGGVVIGQERPPHY